ncbi:DNA replication inhibitor plutonium isoform X3 [Drosophila montana]|uniref:DNA replication inhibitor plutonium isoform X3 n=1 Tax=Drosophila montana TaxID=40370 RepID=UPI00313D6CB6
MNVIGRMNALDCVGEDDVMSLRIICTLARNHKYNIEELDKYERLNTGYLCWSFAASGRIVASPSIPGL